jgi:hypothetical protein
MIKPYRDVGCASGGCSSSSPITSIIEGIPGPIGPTGPTGAQGIVGAAGPTGADGIDGVAIFDTDMYGGSIQTVAYSQVFTEVITITDFLETIGNEIHVEIYGSFNNILTPDATPGIYSTKILLDAVEALILTTGNILSYKYTIEIKMVNLGSGNIQVFARLLGESQSGEPNLLILKLDPTTISAGLSGATVSFSQEAQVDNVSNIFTVNEAIFINYKQ